MGANVLENLTSISEKKSVSSHLKMVFKSLLLLLLALPFTQGASCPPSLYTDSQGTIQSPGFNTTGRYDANMSCTYNILVPAGRRIILEFKNLSILGSMPNCGEDSVEIIVGCSNTSIGKFCSCSNLSMPDKIYSYDNCMTLVFKSDGSNEGKGFEAQYTTADNNATRLDPSNCSTDSVTPLHGSIYSPNWPLKYPESASCVWTFNPLQTTIVRFFFTSFDLDGDPICDPNRPPQTGDQISINGTNTSGGQIIVKKRLCTLPADAFFPIKDMKAIEVRFGSNSVRTNDGTGVMAGYATYITGYVDSSASRCELVAPTLNGTTGTTVFTATTGIGNLLPTTTTTGAPPATTGGHVATLTTGTSPPASNPTTTTTTGTSSPTNTTTIGTSSPTTTTTIGTSSPTTTIGTSSATTTTTIGTSSPTTTVGTSSPTTTMGTSPPTSTIGTSPPTTTIGTSSPTTATIIGTSPSTTTTTIGTSPPTTTTAIGTSPATTTIGTSSPTTATIIGTSPPTLKQKTCGYLSIVIIKEWDTSYLNKSSDTFDNVRSSLDNAIGIMFKDTSKYSNLELSGLNLTEKDGNIDVTVKLCIEVKKDDADSSVIDVIFTLKKIGKLGTWEVRTDSVTFKEIGVKFEDWKVEDEECSKCSEGGGGPFVIKRNCESKTHSCNGLKTMNTKDCATHCDACSVAISSFTLIMGILLSFSFNIWK